MSFRDGLEKDTMVAAGSLTRHAADLKTLNLAIVLPEKIPLLKLDTNVNFYFVRFTDILFVQNS